MKTRFFFIFLFFLLLAGFSQAQTAVIYENESCGHCGPYVDRLNEFLKSKGFEITEKNFVNDFEARVEVVQVHQKNNVPIELQGHMVTVLNDSLILEGHVPIEKIDEVFTKYPLRNFPPMVIFQDSMSETPEPYTLMVDGKIIPCSSEKSVSECAQLPGSFSESSLAGLVVFSGLASGIHPCTIGVLLFFIAFLFTIHRSRLNTFKVGGSYILGVFLSYFLIGLGILQAMAFPEPHFAAKIAAVLVIALGVFNVVRFFFPQVKGFGFPSKSKEWISDMVQKASVPSALILGIFVGICSFGCTAGIYLSIIGFLITQPSAGLFYLFVYNIMFILPLVLILIFVTNKRVAGKIEKVEKSNIRYITLAAGIMMIILGIVLWFLVAGVH